MRCVVTDHWKDPVFETGQRVVCKGTDYDYNIREGKEYTVLEYTPRYREEGDSFTWPAYVDFEDDRGQRRTAHARRFKAVDA